MNRNQALLELVKTLRKDATTQGISTGTGLNYYYLEQQAKLIYPVFYPLLASIPRGPAMYNGSVVGGPGVNWKAITAIDAGGYPGISEGNRSSFMKFTEKDYFAAYKYFGKDTKVSFQAQQTGLGLDDNIGIAQVSLLNALLNDEERMILYGNSGSAGNGFQLGTAPTPVSALVLDSVLTGTIPGSTNVSIFVIALTGWGTQFAVATGVQLPFARTNADGSQDIINGGTSAVSAGSNVVATDSTHHAVKATWAAVNGALGYAVYVNSTDASAPTTSNAVFSQVVFAPTVTITALPTGTNQKANASSAQGNFTTDNSANALDMDGLTTWAFNYAAATPQPSYVKDLGGANLTSNGDGTIAEFETALDFLWQQYKLTPDRIYTGGTLIDAVSKKIAGAGVANNSTRFVLTEDQQGKMIGGNFAVAYRSKYGPGQAKQMDVMTHPWLPQGCIYFDLINNPYPAAGNAIPSVRRIVTLEDHFSIKFPYRNLNHELGVYCFETLAHYIPFGQILITGIGLG